MDTAQWNETIENNLTAAFVTCREFLAGVAAQPFDDPSIVLVGSTAGLVGEAGHADYAAAKSGMTVGLMLSLKNEIPAIAPRGRVNAVCPGWTATPMTGQFTANEIAMRRALSTIALRKFASPDDIANAVLFLSSSKVAGHITGQVLAVSGGMEGRKVHDEADIDLERAIPSTE
jgi:NAD(P)-dependent dehydrogenase (short-subunit alcohol dehydrogenase family)